VWLDETAEGNVYSALRTREADLDKHLINGDEKKDAEREKERDEQRTKLEAELAKNNNKPLKPLPEFGSPEDFQLNQALNRLRGQPVVVSKTATERKPEDTSTN